MIAPFTVPATVPAESPQFPICMTVRTKRALFGHLVAAQPYFGACLCVFLGDSGDPRVMVCDRSDLIATPHVISKFGRTTVGVPAEDANAMTGCVLDRRSFPPGEPILIVRPKPGVEELESQSLRIEKIIPQGQLIVVRVGPQKPGIYDLFGDFHADTCIASLVVKN